MFTKKALLLVNLLLVIYVQLKAQDTTNTIPALFKQYNQQVIKEKIFAHTDKSFYTAGEIIWFKLYTVDAGYNRPLSLSKVAYVEVINEANKPLLKAKIQLKEGYGDGSLYIPLAAASGSYKLRAYTNWMKNEEAAYFFEKNITIVNTQKVSVVAIANRSEKIDVTFFPEGGNLVNNIKSKVAFKAVDESGTGVDFTGTLTDDGDTVLKFNPYHSGMGSFNFTPQSSHSYKAYIKSSTGKIAIKELPAVYTSGYVMNVTGTGDDKIKVTVESDKVYPEEMYLFVHTRGSVKVANAAVLQNGSAVFAFDKALLDDGISHITVFNNKKQPVCERLWFKKPAKQLQLSLTNDQPVYSTRAKVNLGLAFAEPLKTNDTAGLSLAVYRLDSLQSLDEDFIETYLLLTSDLKGKVDNPQYYFSGNEKEKEEALDNLMLTNGWRKFKWDNILQQQKPLINFIPEFAGHIITATISNAQTGKPEKDVETYLSVPGLLTRFTAGTSDINGQAAFEMRKFTGSSDIILQTHNKPTGSFKIDIHDPFSKDYSANPYPQFIMPALSPNTLLEHSVSMQVQNIFSGEELNRHIAAVEDTSTFYLKPDARYMLDDYTRFTTLEEVIREYVFLVNLRKRDGKFQPQIFDLTSNAVLSTNTIFFDNPLVLLDGVAMLDFNKFMSFDPLKIKKLDVINRKYSLGASTFDGILNWTTYKGDLAGFELDPSAVVIDYEGLQLEREFYAPLYDTHEKAAAHLPDFRNVLYWNPNIKISGNDTSTIQFYTSDLPGKYVVVAQGLSKQGLFGSKVLGFEVRKL